MKIRNLNINETMRFTIEAMKRPLLNHGIKSVDEIGYFNIDTKNNSVLKRDGK